MYREEVWYRAAIGEAGAVLLGSCQRGEVWAWFCLDLMPAKIPIRKLKLSNLPCVFERLVPRGHISYLCCAAISRRTTLKKFGLSLSLRYTFNAWGDCSKQSYRFGSQGLFHCWICINLSLATGVLSEVKRSVVLSLRSWYSTQDALFSSTTAPLLYA